MTCDDPPRTLGRRRLNSAAKLPKLDLDRCELVENRLNVGRSVFTMLWKLCIFPARGAAHVNGCCLSVETPPSAVRKQVALLARVDGVLEKLLDLAGLRQAAATFHYQSDHACRTRPRAPLVRPLFTEARLFSNDVLKRGNLAFQRSVREHHAGERESVRRDLLRFGERHQVRVH